jgi:hypothetical protein
MPKLRNPSPPPKEVQFKTSWETSAANKRVSLPPAIAPDVMDIARCVDRKPEIAVQLLEYAQSLLAE